MALENIVISASRLRARLQPQALLIPRHLSGLASSQPGHSVVEPSLRRRWLITFAFGLVHGFGFSFALRQSLQYAGSHLLTSLLSFNIGVELGQLLVLALLVPALQFLFTHVVAERTGGIILSAIVGHTAWHWMTERWAALREFRPPGIDLVVLTGIVRVLLGLVIAAGLVWLATTLRARGSALGVRRSGPAEAGRYGDEVSDRRL